MIAIGGLFANSGCILYNYNTNTWQEVIIPVLHILILYMQLTLPQSVSDRYWHSLSVFAISHHCMLLVMFGGYYRGGKYIDYYSGTTIIELGKY